MCVHNTYVNSRGSNAARQNLDLGLFVYRSVFPSQVVFFQLLRRGLRPKAKQLLRAQPRFVYPMGIIGWDILLVRAA